MFRIFVFVDALFYQDLITERKSSSSAASKKGIGYRVSGVFRVNILEGRSALTKIYQFRLWLFQNHFDYGDGDSLDTIESRRHSFVVPIVKLRKASEDVS